MKSSLCHNVMLNPIQGNGSPLDVPRTQPVIASAALYWTDSILLVNSYLGFIGSDFALSE